MQPHCFSVFVVSLDLIHTFCPDRVAYCHAWVAFPGYLSPDCLVGRPPASLTRARQVAVNRIQPKMTGTEGLSLLVDVFSILCDEARIATDLI
jgi:hypothetical protein